MLYLKGFLLGIAGAVIAAAVWVLVSFVLPLYAPMLIDKRGIASSSMTIFGPIRRCSRRSVRSAR
jgi:hypothetical protein